MSERLLMLDTNMVSYVIRERDKKVNQQLSKAGMENLCISVITEAELYYGLARRPEARKLAQAVQALLARVQIRTWDSDTARAYANLRVFGERQGLSLSNLDMQIAAHAIAVDAILVTHDQAFKKFAPRLKTEDWIVQ